MTILRQAFLDVGLRMGSYPDSPVMVIIFTEKQFMEITDSQEWVGGSFDLLDGKIRIPGADIQKGGARLKAIIYHEYSHAALHHLSQVPVPTWFDEGLAQHFEGRYAPLLLSPSQIALGKTIVENPQVSFLGLASDQARSAYQTSLSLFSFLDRTLGSRRSRPLPALVRLLSQGTAFPDALRQAYGVTLPELLKAWEKTFTP